MSFFKKKSRINSTENIRVGNILLLSIIFIGIATSFSGIVVAFSNNVYTPILLSTGSSLLTGGGILKILFIIKNK